MKTRLTVARAYLVGEYHAAVQESQIATESDFVHDGEQLMNYLLHRPPFEDAEEFPEI